MAVWKFGPALATGNTVVLKPSDTTPVTTSLLGRIVGEHLPPGVMNIVIGDRSTGRALVDHPIPELISVTGSTHAGQEVSLAAAADLKRVHLELGGKAPVVVFDDVDIAVRRGRRRGGGTRELRSGLRGRLSRAVHERIYDEFVEAMVAEYAGKSHGRPSDSPDVGPMNNAVHLAKVTGFLDRVPGHAKVCIGGSADPIDGGFYVEPTIVTGLHQDDEMIQDEVFGPVQTVQSFRDEEEALRMANDVRYGLAASVWTRDYETALRVSGDLDFGQVWINCHLIQPARAPQRRVQALRSRQRPLDACARRLHAGQASHQRAAPPMIDETERAERLLEAQERDSALHRGWRGRDPAAWSARQRGQRCHS